MKAWQVALIGLAVAAIAVMGTLLFVRQTEESPQTDTPRYTADQVIAVAKAYVGEECVGWATVYLGHGKWMVTAECEPKYPWLVENTEVTWTFYEATGELKSG